MATVDQIDMSHVVLMCVQAVPSNIAKEDLQDACLVITCFCRRDEIVEVMDTLLARQPANGHPACQMMAWMLPVWKVAEEQAHVVCKGPPAVHAVFASR